MLSGEYRDLPCCTNLKNKNVRNVNNYKVWKSCVAEKKWFASNKGDVNKCVDTCGASGGSEWIAESISIDK